MWSVGIIVFLVLVGYLPIMKETQTELFAEIRTGKWKFNLDDWKNISSDARDFVKNLLNVDPEQRWKVDEAIESPWICNSAEESLLTGLSTSIEFLRDRRASLRKHATPVIWENEGDDQPQEATNSGGDVSEGEDGEDLQ
jgi:serine/threonine protein kinase